jgi:tRNA G26 N,N-dimethylase Trm1
MRAFLRNDKSKKVDEVLRQHYYFNNAGPVWVGRLWDRNLCEKMYSKASKNKILNKNIELIKFLKIIKEESKISIVGFYDLHDICEKKKIKNLQKKDTIIERIKKFNYKASNTHFKGEAIRSSIPVSKLIKILKNK